MSVSALFVRYFLQHTNPVGVENMEPKTNKILSDFADGFRSNLWKVQLKNRLTEQAFRVEYSHEQLLRATGFLRKKNFDGFDIYARPVGWQYVMLNDLTRPTLTDLADLKPCALVETSPNNYQAWLILADVPPDRDTAKAICRELAQRFGADPASAEPDHVGRLPGFTNRKEKYRQPNGLFPFVKLHRSEHRLADFHPNGAGVLQENEPTATGHRRTSGPGGHSESEKDFGIACGLIRKGLTDEQIYDYLTKHSPDLEARKGSKHIGDYLARTVRNAHRTINQ